MKRRKDFPWKFKVSYSSGTVLFRNQITAKAIRRSLRSRDSLFGYFCEDVISFVEFLNSR